MEIRNSKGQFIKGHKSLDGMKGKKHSEETRKKITLKLMGRKLSKESIIKRTETRRKNHAMGKSNFGKNKIMPREAVEKIRLANTGKKRSEEFKKRMSLLKKGKTHEQIYGKEQSKLLIENFKKKRREQRFPIKNTNIEIKIQNYLKELKIEFFTHYRFKEINSHYVCDILIPVQKSRSYCFYWPLIIECDGNYWHKYPIGLASDKIKDENLLKNGFRILRLWGSDIKEMNLYKFEEIIKNVF